MVKSPLHKQQVVCLSLQWSDSSVYNKHDFRACFINSCATSICKSKTKQSIKCNWSDLQLHAHNFQIIVVLLLSFTLLLLFKCNIRLLHLRKAAEPTTGATVNASRTTVALSFLGSKAEKCDTPRPTAGLSSYVAPLPGST